MDRCFPLGDVRIYKLERPSLRASAWFEVFSPRSGGRTLTRQLTLVSHEKIGSESSVETWRFLEGVLRQDAEGAEFATTDDGCGCYTAKVVRADPVETEQDEIPDSMLEAWNSGQRAIPDLDWE